MKRLNEKIAIVTGAASGIGAEIARMYAAEGAKVVLADRNSEDGTAVAENINALGGEAIFSRIDLMCKDDIADHPSPGTADLRYRRHPCQLCWSPRQRLLPQPLTDDHFDIVPSTNIPGHDLDDAGDHSDDDGEWRRQHRQSRFDLCHMAGVEIPPSTVRAKPPWPNSAEDVAREFAGQGVRVNTLLPGPTDTPLMRFFMRNDLERLAEFTKSTAVLGRLCESRRTSPTVPSTSPPTKRL